MVKPKKNVVENMPQNKNENQGYCRICKKILPANKFYQATNPMIDKNNLMSVCIEHCKEIYNSYFSIYNNIDEALQLTCRDLDVCFNKQALKETKSHIEKLISNGKKAESVFGYYKSKLSSTSKNNDSIEGFRYKDSDVFEEQKFKNQIKELSLEYRDVNNNLDFEINQEMISFWGTDNKSELFFLENEWHNLITRFECDSYSTEMLFQEIAHQRLDIKKKRKENQSVDKELKTLQDLLGSANIKPVQETGANASEQVSFGVLMKKWENEKPIPKPEKEWEDVDSIRRYISIWFLGHLCKMLNLNNDYSKMYEKEMEKYRVELSEDLGDE